MPIVSNKNETFYRQQRWLANTQFLCYLVEENNKTSGQQLTFEQIVDKAILALTNLCQKFNRNKNEITDHELLAYKLEVQDATTYVNDTNWSPSDNELNKQILFEIDCLSSIARDVTQKFWSQADPTNSLLFKMFKVSYLNRKTCLMAENVVADSSSYQDQSGTSLFRLFENAQRVRSSTFSAPFAQKLSTNNYSTFGELKKAYSNVQMEANRPFSKKQHRLRKPRLDVTNDIHRETKTLALNAGAALFRPDDESTLGFIERILGLPERSDISGTNTDAIGLGLTFIKNVQGDELIKAKAFSYYVLICMTTMSLAGHHSLSETATAASLWSAKNYEPFNAESVINILTSSYQPNATSATETIASQPKTVISYKDEQLLWFTNKWQTLKLDNMTPNDLEFSDGLWWTVKSTLRNTQN